MIQQSRDPARGRRASQNLERASRFLTEASEIVGDTTLLSDEFEALMQTEPDPTGVALGALRVLESAANDQAIDSVRGVFTSRRALARFADVAGTSEASIDHLVRHPQSAAEFTASTEPYILDQERSAPENLRAELLRSVGADPAAQTPLAALTGEDGVAALRVAYRNLLTLLVADDMNLSDPAQRVDDVAAILSDLAGAAIEAGLAVARAETDGSERVALSIIGMGKGGARELNYVSDVDVVFCWEPAPYAADEEAADPDEPQLEELARIATRLAVRVTESVSATAREPALWELDAALRPEGKDGPLVRRLSEFINYYEHSAHNWEFQALLKARPLAGDRDLGNDWFEHMNPLVWTASQREGFIDEVRLMRRRVVSLIPSGETDRQLKLGPGGLRDVEFSAQLLQLVHGSEDPDIRVADTLSAIAALGEGGYISRPDTELLDRAYRFMRVIEHRLQLPRMHRTALLPADEDKLRLLARTVYRTGDRSAHRLVEERNSYSRRVRSVHEQIFYRPILDAVASDVHVVSLSDAAARERLAAFGYRGTKLAMDHIRSLTSGVSRTASVVRQILPAMLDWFSTGVDPDAGLLAFRRLTEELSGSTWYLRLLRDSGNAARALAHVLSLSRFATDLLLKNPTAVAWLDDPSLLRAKQPEALRRELAELVDRHSGSAVNSIRAVWGRETLRTALADVLEDEQIDSGARLSVAMDAVIHASLCALRTDLDATAGITDYEFAVIAMGRLGGAEIGYFSDADVVFVYRAGRSVEGDEATAALTAHVKQLALRLTSELGKAGTSPGIELDADLRPEGRSGPLVRSLASYEKYYAKWSEPWEAQALLRARPIAGNAALQDDYVSLINPLRYPASVPQTSIMQMRRLKARMESERLPRGADRRLHLKLGTGGLSDVEWTVQLLQMLHAHDHPDLQVTPTLRALHALVDDDLLSVADGQILEQAWLIASRVRSGIMLFRGRTADCVPADRSEREATARLLGLGTGASQRLMDSYLAATRRARRVVERIFFDVEEDERSAAFTSGEGRPSGRR